MPMTMKEFSKWKRPPVAHCQVGNHPIYGNPISSDNPDHEMLNGKPICFWHFEVQKPDIETGGRGSPHGGCGDPR